jgi:formyltetrahydrofolate synthetase
VTLTLDQVEAEARYLHGQGFLHILLVAGEHPHFVSGSYLRECVGRLRASWPSISLEVGPMETEDYRPIVEAGAEGAYVSEVWAKGGAGGVELAEAVVRACEKPSQFKFLYPVDAPIKEKIETVATKVYGAARVEYAPAAEQKVKLFTDLGYDKFPINMAKTHLSLSHDPNRKGVPTGYAIPIRDIRASVGAGFLYPLCGEMSTMPGLPTIPAGTKVDIDKKGEAVGLF